MYVTMVKLNSCVNDVPRSSIQQASYKGSTESTATTEIATRRRGTKCREGRKEDENGEEDGDQSESRMYQRCCSKPSRPESPPHKSLRALLSTTGSALLKDVRTMILPFRQEPRSEKEPPSILLAMDAIESPSRGELPKK